MNKQLIQEVSRIHELMGVNNLIVEQNRFTQLSDDLVDIIRTVKGTDNISTLSRTEQDFFNSLDAAVAANKEDEIIDILKSYEKTAGVSKYINDINTALFKKINNDIPELKNLTDTLISNKDIYSPQDLLLTIDNKLSQVQGSDYYKNLYKNRLKKELGIPDTVKTTRVADDVVDLSPEAIAARQAEAQRLSDEISASIERELTSLEDDVIRLSGTELVAKMDEFINSWSKKLYEADLKLPKKKRWFKDNKEYKNFVDELKKGMKSTYKSFNESIDAVPEKWFENFNELPAETQKKIFENAIRGASTFKPKGKAGKVWSKITKGYDWSTLKPLYSKLPGGSAKGWKGFFKRMGYRYLTTILGQIWFTFINSMYKKFTDEKLINWKSTKVLDDWITGGADAGSPRAVIGDIVGFLTGPIFLPWNIFSNLLSTTVYSIKTPDKVNNGFTQSQIKNLQDQGLTASDVESLQIILDFISSVTSESVEDINIKLTSDISVLKALFKTFTSIGENKNYADLLYGLPISSGINQFVVDKNKELWYVASNGAFKIEGEGQNSYITAVDSEGQEVQIKIKDIFDDKFNRFLPDYKPVSEQPTNKNFVQFWPKEIKWDNRGSDKQNAENSKLVGVHNSNLVSILTEIKKYLFDNNIDLPSKYLQTYGFYDKGDITREQNGDISVEPGSEKSSFAYLVDDGKAYRIKEADKDYFNLEDTDGDYIRDGEYYVTDGSKWAKLTTKAKEILRTTNNSQTTTNESPEQRWLSEHSNGSFKKLNPNKPTTWLYYTEPNNQGDRYIYKDNQFIQK